MQFESVFGACAQAPGAIGFGFAVLVRLQPVTVRVPGGIAQDDAPAGQRPLLFVDGQDRLLRVDVTTGVREVVAGPGAPAGERLKLD